MPAPGCVLWGRRWLPSRGSASVYAGRKSAQRRSTLAGRVHSESAARLHPAHRHRRRAPPFP
eukprot:3932248-Rhodomonas_salina.2